LSIIEIDVATIIPMNVSEKVDVKIALIISLKVMTFTIKESE